MNTERTPEEREKDGSELNAKIATMQEARLRELACMGEECREQYEKLCDAIYSYHMFGVAVIRKAKNTK